MTDSRPRRPEMPLLEGVNGCSDKTFKGNLPEVDPIKFNALPAAKKKAPVDEGLIKVTPKWTKADYGRVGAEPFLMRECRRASRQIYIVETTSLAISYPAKTAVPKPAATRRTINAAVTA
jgi:hypothetical protein